MKKRVLSVLLSLVMLIGLFPTAVLATEEAGIEPVVETVAETDAAVWDGTSVNTEWYSEGETEYTISTAADLAGLAKLVNEGNSFSGKTVKLGADIDLDNQEWTPIGGTDTGKSFAGTFDGEKSETETYTISNLNITRGLDNVAANNRVGLFGRTDSPAEIKNITIENATVKGSLFVGALVGYPYTGKGIINCHVKGTIQVDGYWYVGGLAGSGYASPIQNCSVIGDGTDSSHVTITGGYVGGIIGQRGEGNMITTGCAVQNITVSGAYNGIGGISGILQYGNTISDCTLEDVVVWQTTGPDADEDNRIYCGAFAGTYLDNNGTSAPTLSGNTFTGELYSGTEKTDILEETRYVGGLWYGAEPPATVNITNCTITMPPVAQIGNEGYATLEAAIEAADEGDTILVLAEEIAFPAITKKNLTIKSNIKTKIVESHGAVSDGTTIDGFIYTVPAVPDVNKGIGYSAKDFTIRNCTFTGYNGFRWAYASGTWLIENCVFDTQVYGIHFDGNSGATVNIKDSVISGFNTFVTGLNVNVTGCTFKGSEKNGYSVFQTRGNTVVKDSVIDASWVGVSGGKNFCNANETGVFEVYNLQCGEGVDLMELAGSNGIFVVDPTKNAEGKYTSGTFAVEPAAEKLAEDTVAIENGDGTWTVGKNYTFTVNPSTAAVTLSSEVVGENGVYTLNGGYEYTYTVSASGYVTKTGTIEAGNTEDVTVTLERKSSSSTPSSKPTAPTTPAAPKPDTSAPTVSTDTKTDAATGSTTVTETKKDGTTVETTTNTDGSSTTTATKTEVKETAAGTTTTTATNTSTTTAAGDKVTENKVEQTVEKKDGTTATTVTTNTKTETADGSTKTEAVVVETVVDKEGKETTTSKTETKLDNGSTGTTTVAADGSVTAEVKVTNTAVSNAAKAETAVALPMPAVAATTAAETAPVVALTVPNSTNSVSVEIPVAKASTGVVAVIVNADGTEEIVKTSVVTENGVVLAVDGDVTVKIMNNEKEFSDTGDHWAADAVTFVTAREVYNGTSATTFTPDGSMTRGMLTKVLHNLENNPETAFDGSFSDLNDHWAADSIQWAAENGIVGGYSDGSFGADDNITREQLAVMLWRYAGSPESSHDLSQFGDAANISDYAKVALAWASEHGIVSGVGSNTMDPQGNATRAQVATMLMRMMQNAF